MYLCAPKHSRSRRTCAILRAATIPPWRCIRRCCSVSSRIVLRNRKRRCISASSGVFHASDNSWSFVGDSRSCHAQSPLLSLSYWWCICNMASECHRTEEGDCDQAMPEAPPGSVVRVVPVVSVSIPCINDERSTINVQRTTINDQQRKMNNQQ